MTRDMVGEDADPLNVRCDACGAEPAEDCRPGCIGKAQHDDEVANERVVLGRTTNGSELLVFEP